jgi:predicted KAP-like P-loop ATPase
LTISSNDKQNIGKDESTYKIITDEPAKDASDFRNYSERLSQIIVKSIPQFTVGIFGGWGTGKTTMMQMIKEEIDKNYSDVATTIWFDSWRYEREEYSLMIPLLRTIILTLHNVIDQTIDDKKKKILRKVTSGFVKMIKAVARGTGINFGGEIDTGIAKVSAGLSLDFEKILDEYEDSSGEPEKRVYINQKKIIFHKHTSDYLREELDNIKNKHRLIIFIDDLDRCTPDRALEILESIKTFFDIEGIIYVIGMDPATIDTIILSKYGENSKINGLHYLQKIVQLPFQIPLWSDNDLTDTIKEMTEKTGLKTVT